MLSPAERDRLRLRAIGSFRGSRGRRRSATNPPGDGSASSPRFSGLMAEFFWPQVLEMVPKAVEVSMDAAENAPTAALRREGRRALESLRDQLRTSSLSRQDWLFLYSHDLVRRLLQGDPPATAKKIRRTTFGPEFKCRTGI